ncbi:MAG: hypothetical protein AAFR81_02245 [Chloroflexota bacterium]
MKVKQSRFTIFFVGFLVLFALGIVMAFSIPILQRTDWQPTAEFVQSNPADLPDFVGHIEPAPQTTINSESTICIGILPGGISEDAQVVETADTTLLFHNGRRTAFSTDILAIMQTTRLGNISGRYDICTERRLPQGINLFELVINADEDSAYRYTWTYYVA